jgi:hypothetical protein
MFESRTTEQNRFSLQNLDRISRVQVILALNIEVRDMEDDSSGDFLGTIGDAESNLHILISEFLLTIEFRSNSNTAF